MLDARTVCHGFFLIIHDKEMTEVPFKNEDLQVRVKCDSIIFMEQARRLCQHRQEGTLRIEAYLISKQYSDSTSTVVVREKDICQKWD